MGFQFVVMFIDSFMDDVTYVRDKCYFRSCFVHSQVHVECGRGCVSLLDFLFVL